MKAATAHGPGSPLPPWVQALDEATFGKAWGPLSSVEWMWTLEDQAYARWSVLPGVEAELLRVAVNPGAQRQGLATRLLRLSEEALRHQGCQRLLLEVRPSNAAARALYAGLGWTDLGRRARYYPDGEDALILEKHLGDAPPQR